MKLAKPFALACVATLALGASAVTGCAADRPFRNGVPNEQFFLRKEFIIRPGANAAPDQPAADDGWLLKATVVKTSTPNPFAESVLFTGAENGGMLVRFAITQDQLQLINMREISENQAVADQGTRTPEIVNSWRAQHVDLKLAVTNDGEKTNRFEENMELDWRVRQWVQVDLARNDYNDFNLFGQQVANRIQRCAAGGTSTSIVPGSLLQLQGEGKDARMEGEESDYIEWTTRVTIPVNMSDPACVESFGESGQNFARMGRQNVTADIKYSLVRATPLNKITYKPLQLDEKDPIRRKYGAITQTNWTRDPESQQMAARELAVRFDPEKEIVLYFAQGYPEERKAYFTGPGGIVDQTNAVFEKAGAKARLVVRNYDEGLDDAPEWERKRGRQYGDVRYNFIRWMSDLDIGAPFIGVAQFVPDPRTGEALSASINIAEFPLKEFVAQRVDGFLQTIMCNKSGTVEIEGSIQQVCLDLNADQEWGPPMEEYEDAEGKIKHRPRPETCKEGEVAEILPKTLRDSYGKSSLFSKMQEYMGEKVSDHGNLGPRDMTAALTQDQNADFEAAYFKLVPYYIFADPALNEFVTSVNDGGEFGSDEQYKELQRVHEFHQLTDKISRGEEPFNADVGPNYVDQAVSFLDQLQAGRITQHHHKYAKQFLHNRTMKADTASDVIAFTSVMEKAGRRCVGGRWETKAEWLKNLEDTYNALTVWHEFGHILGMEHNFLASMDKPNYPVVNAPNCDPAKDANKCKRYGMYSSSVMEYATTPDRIFWSNESGVPGWGAYDRGAIGWIYGNAGSLDTQRIVDAKSEFEKLPAERKGVSGQVSATMPWNDPEGFRADGTEIQFLYCNEKHTRYSPFCRAGDFGSTPSEIIANELEAYEWQYAWRNFRKYRKVWDVSNYADLPNNEIIELRRFLPLWRSDWSGTRLRDEFGRLGIKGPDGAQNNTALYYGQLMQMFDNEMSATNSIVAAFHLAVIQQSSGERPFVTIYDKFFGDVTQQGIFLDKMFAMQGWVGLWPQNNYNPSDAGNFISSFAGVGDAEYQSIAFNAVSAMIGEQQFDAFPFLKAAAVVLYSRDTHRGNFSGDDRVRDWIGSKIFPRQQDFLDYFRQEAVTKGRFPEMGCVTGEGKLAGTDIKASIATCEYDPTLKRGAQQEKDYLSDDYNEFKGPDEHRWTWMKIHDRNQWVFADKDRNTAMYKIIRDYNVAVIKAEEESDTAYAYLKPIKYTVDAFHRFN